MHVSTTLVIKDKYYVLVHIVEYFLCHYVVYFILTKKINAILQDDEIIIFSAVMI